MNQLNISAGLSKWIYLIMPRVSDVEKAYIGQIEGTCVSQNQVAANFGSPSAVSKWKTNYRATGDVKDTSPRSGRPLATTPQEDSLLNTICPFESEVVC